jgi:hypothetical protein
LVDAVSAFAERVFETGEEMLRERVRATHRPFKDYLTGLHGDSLVWSTDEALTGVTRELAYKSCATRACPRCLGISTPTRCCAQPGGVPAPSQATSRRSAARGTTTQRPSPTLGSSPPPTSWQASARSVMPEEPETMLRPSAVQTFWPLPKTQF